MRTPVFGNVYVLPAKASQRMSKGDPPGCWVAPELVERIRREARVPDNGLAARLERAARMVAIVRGLGYAGAYLGGDHQADRIRWIIKRSEEIAPRWEEFAEEFNYAPRNGFYFFDASKAPSKKRSLVPRLLDALAGMFPVNKKGNLRSVLVNLFRWVDKRPVVSRGVERLEFTIKSPLFGCQTCGNCVLGQMEYVCPQTCPKNMRNGPCGGTKNGQCEVVDKPCIWTGVFERAKSAGRLEDLKVYIPPPTRALKGTSSWVNFFLSRDSRPGTVSLLTPAVDANAPRNVAGPQASNSHMARLSVPDSEVPVAKSDAHRH